MVGWDDKSEEQIQAARAEERLPKMSSCVGNSTVFVFVFVLVWFSLVAASLLLFKVKHCTCSRCQLLFPTLVPPTPPHIHALIQFHTQLCLMQFVILMWYICNKCYNSLYLFCYIGLRFRGSTTSQIITCPMFPDFQNSIQQV